MNRMITTFVNLIISYQADPQFHTLQPILLNNIYNFSSNQPFKVKCANGSLFFIHFIILLNLYCIFQFYIYIQYTLPWLILLFLHQCQFMSTVSAGLTLYMRLPLC